MMRMMRSHTLATVAAAVGVVALLPTTADAQVRASERATVSQTVDGTVITVDYSRPRAKGRALFGGIVRWDRPWTGANEATVLELNKDVTIQGVDVPAGRYSVWTVPAEQGPWEMFLDPRTDLWHTARPGPADDQIRFPVEPTEGGHVEVLTWTFPHVAADCTTLELAWGTERVPVDIEVEPSSTRTVAAERARPFVGSWRLQWELGGEASEEPVPFDVSYNDDGELRARTIYPTPEGGVMDADLVLLPRAEGVFVPALLRDGEIYDTAAYLFIEFTYEADRPTGFVVRWADNDTVIGRGQRTS